MNRNVLTVLPSTTLKDLINLMQKTNQHIFPVLADDGTLLGVVNYNDILNIFRPFSRSVSWTFVASVSGRQSREPSMLQL